MASVGVGGGELTVQTGRIGLEARLEEQWAS